MAKVAIPKTSQKVQLRERTVPIPSSVEKVKGHKTLTIYKMEASPYYYVRLYEDKKILRRSTKTEDRREAIRFAEEFFVEIKTKKLNKLPLTTKSGFEVCAWGLLKENEAKVKRKELAARKIDHDKRRLEADLLPFFKKYEVADIDYSAITAYIAKLNEDPDERFLSTNSLKVHLSHIKTILKYAQRHGVIKTLPAFPTLKTVDEPRGWFSKKDYTKLHNTARTHVGERFEIKTKDGNVVRTGVLTQEIYELILFMVKTFIRPTDIRVLKHKHVEVVLNKQDAFLRLTHPATKKHASPMVSMPKAIEVYKEILKRQKKDKLGGPEDFVFQPEHPENRDYAIQQLHRQFDHLLKITGLKQDPAGRPRTLYSLRHTAIMFRLTESQGLDLLSLARAARTSVEMIDRFYAKHLTAEMNVAKIQSQRSETKQRRTKALKNRLLSEEEDD